MAKLYFGKYRGKVENNIDPTGHGRVQVSVPGLTVGGDGWAEPCVPFSGSGVGFFAVPPKGSSVWVEFERGNINRAILAGGFWEKTQLTPAPIPPLAHEYTVLKTDKFKLEVNNNPALASLTLEMDAGPPVGKATIKIDKTGMKLEAAGNSIALQPGFVSINGSNLKVLK